MKIFSNKVRTLTGNVNCLSLSSRSHLSLLSLSRWETESNMLTNQFLDKWTFSKNILNTLNEISGESEKDIVNSTMDHLTYNLGSEEEAKFIENLFIKHYQLEKVEKLIFIPKQVHGYLLWVPYSNKYSRLPGIYKPNCGVQGIFIRYMTDEYLKELNLSHDQIKGWNLKDLHHSSLSDVFSQHQYHMNKKKRTELLNSGIANRYLSSYLTNGIYGHFAVDVIALGTSLKEIEEYIIQKKINYGLFHNWNDKKTVRQLYLYEKEREIINNNSNEREEPLEIFFELVERDEVTSISAKKIIKLKDV